MAGIKARCYKFKINNGPIVDITPDVIDKVIPYLQVDSISNEAGGCLVGFQNCETNNITINNVSTPGKTDIRTRVFCRIRDKVHKIFLNNQRNDKNYYMGSWHTHPTAIPTPSSIDLEEWNIALTKDKTGCKYIFFLIFGYQDFGVWCGEFESHKIARLYEMDRIDDLY